MTDTTTRKRKRPSLSSLLTQMLKAGVVPTGMTMAPDGSVSLNFGKRDEIESKANNHSEKKNEWDSI